MESMTLCYAISAQNSMAISLGAGMDIGIVVDVETTGLDAQQDQIIEIGILSFGLEEGALPVILESYGGLQDPGRPLSAEIAKLTGLSDAALRGQNIRWDIVRDLFAQAEVVIAHNAKFDRGFLELRPELADLKKHWACSASHIDWTAHGIQGRKLIHIAAESGFVNPFAHRALFDCATTFRVISPYIQELVARSYEREALFSAVGSSIDKKDVLKKRGYRWNPPERVWERTVAESQWSDERNFLASEIYDGESRHHEKVV
jgi:DNA polymerase III subunit epsilon